jgi:hypothetical protein
MSSRVGEDFEDALRTSTEMARVVEQTTRLAAEVRANSAAVLRAVKSYRQFTDAVLAMRAAGEMSRGAVQSYMSGRAALTVDKMAVFAEALAITPKLFFDPPDVALRWVLDNSPNPDPTDPSDQDERGSSPPTKWYANMPALVAA